MPRKKVKQFQQQKKCSNCSQRFVKKSSLSGLCVKCSTSVNSPNESDKRDEFQCSLSVESTLPVPINDETVVSPSEAEKYEYTDTVLPILQATMPSIPTISENIKQEFLCSTMNDTDFDFSEMPPLIVQDDDTTISEEDIKLGFEEEEAEKHENIQPLCCENCCRDAICGVTVTTREGIAWTLLTLSRRLLTK